MTIKYFKDLSKFFKQIEVRDKSGKAIAYYQGIAQVFNLVLKQAKKGNKVILIGNGGSASIASHIATDILKNAHIPAIAFNDSSLITCISNDLGYEYVFEKPIQLLAKKGDILFSISSSGSSRNIINATLAANRLGCFVVTLSGFAKDNPLRKMGEFNFYLPSNSYGYVEVVHLAICHNIVDTLTEKKPHG